MDLLLQIEQSAFGSWVRETPSLLAYPAFLFLHTLGLGLLVGTSVAMNLRVLGCGPQMSLAPLERFFPLLWAGFWINAISGVVIWTADATTLTRNPVFWVKLLSIVLAMASIRLFRARAFAAARAHEPFPTSLKALAGASLGLWMLAITAGRLTAYVGR